MIARGVRRFGRDSVAATFALSISAASFLLACETVIAQTNPQPVTADTIPTFAHDIAPIIIENCAPCHRPGEAGPFSLLTYSDVKKHARQIASVTGRRYMPPWLPERGYGDFKDERRLTDEQIRLIDEWATHGAPEGIASETPPIPHFTEGWALGPPDLIVEAEQPFTVPASGPDVYWNFILTPNIPGRRYVKAIEIRPGQERVVHHANLYVDRARTARAQEPSKGAGFAGMDPIIERTAFDPDDGHFLFWKPGGSPYVEPDGMSWRLDPGNDLVLNVHAQTSGKVEQVKPAIGLYFTDQPPKSYPMLLQLEHDGALDIPAGNPDFLVSDDFRLPLDAEVLAVYPHAHYLGHVLEGYATLPSGERKWLVRIPEWDQAWQAVYRYQKPVFLPKGTVISMRYHYDNSAKNPRNPHDPPQRVEAGNQSTDEMGHLWLQILPSGKEDRRRELGEAILRHRLEKYPDDFNAHLSLGAVLLARLNAPGAAAALRDAVRLKPGDPEAHNLLGAALNASGQAPEALREFRQALALRPDYPNAQLNLADALIARRGFPEAIANLRPLVAANPEDTLAMDRLAKALFAQGKALAAKGEWAQAEACDREVAAMPAAARKGVGEEAIQAALAEALAEQGKFAEALESYDRAILLDPTNEDLAKARMLAVRRLASQSSERH